MISAWWLLLVPVASVIGYCVCGFLSRNSEIERCEQCKYKKEKSE